MAKWLYYFLAFTIFTFHYNFYPFHPIMQTLYSFSRRINWLFISLLSLLFVVNLSHFSADFSPFHDTHQTFQGFYYFYTHFYSFGELPKWSLYGTYGTPMGFWQLVFLTPASYFSFLLGWIFSIQNALTLFKIAFFLEQLILLLGTYKLSKLLFHRRLTIFFVCAGTISCVVWYAQVWWNFRIYYMLPLIIYFLFLFFLRQKPQYLWYAGIISVISLIGNLMYFSIPWILLLLTIAIVMSIKHWKAWEKLLLPSKENILSFLSFILLAFLYTSFLFYCFEYIDFSLPGRDTETYETTLRDFLQYGGQVDAATLLYMLLHGWPIHASWSGADDISVYVGLLPFPLIIYALGKVRTYRFYAMLSSTILLLWIASGSSFATLIYFLPGVSLFRHLSLLFGLIKIFLIICAGFGLDALIKEEKGRHIIVASGVMLFLIDFFAKQTGFEQEFWWRMEEYWSRVFVFRLLFYSIPIVLILIFSLLDWSRKRKSPDKETYTPLKQRVIISYVLVIIYVLDIAAFQIVAVNPRPSSRCGECYETMTIQTPPFYLTRTDKPSQPQRVSRAQYFIETLPYYNDYGKDTANVMLYSFFQYDPITSIYKLVLHPYGNRKLSNARKKSPTDDPALSRVLAWDFPKFQLKSNLAFARSIKEGAQIIEEEKNLDELLVLRNIPLEWKTEERTGFEGNIGEINVVRAHANSIDLEVNVTSDSPSWLYYSDSYHPYWKASVNGKEVPIVESYLSFKALPLEKGKNIVQLEYKGWGSTLADLLGFIGIFFYFWFLFRFGKDLLLHPFSSKSKSQ